MAYIDETSPPNKMYLEYRASGYIVLNCLSLSLKLRMKD